MDDDEQINEEEEEEGEDEETLPFTALQQCASWCDFDMVDGCGREFPLRLEFRPEASCNDRKLGREMVRATVFLRPAAGSTMATDAAAAASMAAHLAQIRGCHGSSDQSAYMQRRRSSSCVSYWEDKEGVPTFAWGPAADFFCAAFTAHPWSDADRVRAFFAARQVAQRVPQLGGAPVGLDWHVRPLKPAVAFGSLHTERTTAIELSCRRIRCRRR